MEDRRFHLAYRFADDDPQHVEAMALGLTCTPAAVLVAADSAARCALVANLRVGDALSSTVPSELLAQASSVIRCRKS